MISTAFTYCFIIIFLHACMQEGMIFGKLRWLLDEMKLPEWIRKPLYDCLVCMAGIYTVALWFIKDHHELSVIHRYYFKLYHPFSWDLLWMICIVGGINVVLAPVVDAMIFEFHRIRTSDYDVEETE